MKICLTCGPGGHLVEMLSIIDAFKGHNIFFITVRAEASSDMEKLAHVYYIRNRFKYPIILRRLSMWLFTLIYLLSVALSSFKILHREKPDVIITTGGDETIPICYIGKLLGSKIICIESFTRIYNKSGTGIILYPIADKFLVQWESLLSKYGKKAQYWGKVI